MSKRQGITIQKSIRHEAPPKIVRPLGAGFVAGRPFNLLEEFAEGRLTGFILEEAGATPDFNRRRSESANRHYANITPESRWYADIAALAEQRGWVDTIYRGALEELPRAFAYAYEALEEPRGYIDALTHELPDEWQESARSQLLALLAEVAAPAALDVTFAERRAELFRQIVTSVAANILADIETGNLTYAPPIPETLAGKWERSYRDSIDGRVRFQVRTMALFLAVAATRHATDPALIQASWDKIVDQLAKAGALPRRRRRRHPSKAAPPSPVMLPGFHAGWGTVPNSQATRAAILAIQNGADTNSKWQRHPEHGFPYITAHEVSFSFSPNDYQTVDAAWEAVRALDDATVDTFMIACAHYDANRSHTTDGLVRITPDEVLAQRNIAKHKRTYDPEDREKVAADFEHLSKITVEGHRVGYEATGRKGKSKPIRITLEGRLIESNRARKDYLSDDLALLPGKKSETLGFWYRLGPWANGIFGADGAPQLAEASQAILRYHAKNQRYQKRIGWYLVWIFRNNRGAQRFQVRTLLEQAGIALPASSDKNPRRFRERIEGALADLQRDGVIGSLEWELEALPVRRGLDEWLCAIVRIAPPPALLERYQNIGKPRLRALPGKRETARPAPPDGCKCPP